MSFNNLIIFNNGTSLLDTLLLKFKSKFHPTSIFELFSGSLVELENLKSVKPFFNDHCLLILYTELLDKDSLTKAIKLLKSLEDFICIIVCNTYAQNELTINLIKQDCKTLSLHKPPRWLVEEHIKRVSQKQFKPLAVKELILSLKGQWKLLDDYMREIEATPATLINVSDINKVVPKHIQLYFDSILLSLMTFKITKKDLKSIYAYKYANKFILDECSKCLDAIIKLKLDYLQGYLSFNTLEIYCSDNKLNFYKTKRYLKDFITTMSLEYMYRWKYILKNYRTKQDGFLLLVFNNLGGV